MRSFVFVLKALVLRPLVREKLRTLITISGIAVGVSVLVAIELSNQSALRSFRESVDSVAGRANYQIVSESGPLDESILFGLRPLWSLGGRFAPVVDLEGVLLPSGMPIRILGVDLLSDLHFRDYRYARISTGSSPDSAIGHEVLRGAEAQPAVDRLLELFRPDSVILPKPLSVDSNLPIGSSVTINIGGRDAAFVVRGILETEGPATAFNGMIAIVDIAAAQRSLSFIGKLSRIDLLIPEAHESTALEIVRKVIPASARLERPSRRNDRVEKMLLAFRVNLFALSGVALLVGTFLVYNTVLISVLRRRRDTGIAKTLGTSSPAIFGSFLTEGIFLGLLGSGLGIFLGWGLARSLLGLIERTVNSLYVTTSPSAIELTPGLMLAALLTGTGISLLASLHPSIEAARVPPLAMIRSGSNQALSREHSARLALLSLGLVVAAILVSRIPSIGGISAGGYLAVLFLAGSGSLLAPGLLLVLSTQLSRLLPRFAGIPGRVAAATIPTSLRRISVATASLAVAIGMMVAVAIMIGSFRETVKAWVAQTVQSDLWLRPARSLSNSPVAVFPDSISEALSATPFVEAFDRFRGRDLVYRDSLIAVGSGDFHVGVNYGKLPMVDPRSHERAMSQALERDGVLVSESFAIKFAAEVGGIVRLPTLDGIVSFPITGIYRDYSNDRGVVVMDRALYVKRFRDDTINTVAIFLRDGTDPELAKRELERRLGAKFHAFATTNESIRREVMRIFDQTFLVTYALLVIAIVVAVLGIINTLSALILERTREIALLRVMGMSSLQIGQTILLESSIIGTVSAVLGTLLGLALSTVLIFVINKQSFGWTIAFDLPVVLITALVATTFTSTVLAGLVPARLAQRVRLSAALNQ